MQILQNIQKLFWDTDARSLDPKKNEKEIIVRTLNYGTLRDWKWLADSYGTHTVLGYVSSPLRNAIRPEAKALAELLFS